MSPDTELPIRSLETLVEDVFRLRRVMAQNTVDTRLQRDYAFAYLVDTPVFRLFSEPRRYAGLVAAIPSLTIADDPNPDHDQADSRAQGRPEASQDALFANALLTGEYIFKLAEAQKQPVLISPEHAGEIFAYIAYLESRSQSLYKQARLNRMDVFRDLRDLLLTQSSPAEKRQPEALQWLTANRHPIIRRLSGTAHSPMLAPSRLASLFQRRAVANAAQELRFGEDVISPPYELVAYWKNRIKRVKRGNDTRPSDNAVEADAITLAQVDLLNLQWKSTKRVHVLITSDRGLHRAFAAHKREQEAKNRKVEVFYPIRDPRQYVPLLNVQAMGGGLSDPDIFKKVWDSTRVFASSFTSTDNRIDVDFDRDPSSMPGAGAIRFAIRKRAEQHTGDFTEFEEVVREQLDQISRHWLEAVEAAIVAKTDVIAELENRERAIWSTAMREALRQDLRSQVTELGVSFEDLASTNTLLRQEIWAVERGLQQHEEQPFRNQRKLASDFDEFRYPAFARQPLNQVLSTFRQERGRMMGELRSMANGRSARAERMFLTGCVSLEIGAWAGAEALLSRARSIGISSASLRREVTFFLCIAKRLSASGETFPRDYRQARGDLNILCATPAGTFDRVRLRNELLALDLSEIAFRRWSKAPLEEPLAAANGSWRDLGTYHERLLQPAENDVWRIASKQFLLNTCNLAYWHYALGSHISDRLREVTQQVLRAIEGHASLYATDTVHGTIYPLLAKFALSRDAARGELSSEIERAIDSAVEYDRNAGIAFDLPYVDKAEFATIKQVLRVGPDG